MGPKITAGQFIKAMLSVALPVLCLFAGVPLLFVGVLGLAGYLADAGPRENVAIGWPYLATALVIFAATAIWFLLTFGRGQHRDQTSPKYRTTNRH